MGLEVETMSGRYAEHVFCMKEALSIVARRAGGYLHASLSPE
jgi:hypothetical protein